MIKLTASLSKKVTIAGMNYSSQSFLAGLEVELSDAAALPEVQARIREVYQLLENSVNEQIATHREEQRSAESGTGNQERKQLPTGWNNSSSSNPNPRDNRPYNRDAGRRNNSRDNGKNEPFPASQAQLKAITAIAKDQQLTDDDLADLLRQNFRKGAPAELTLREASKLITILKENRQAS